MRSALDKWINSVWYQRATPPWYLRAIEPFYSYFSSRSNPGKNQSINIPIVVVGNISVGGTGKTPLVISLCQQLLAAGFKPAVISRGYGRRSKGLRVVTVNDDSSESGDEALLIKSQTGVPVLVDSDRLNAVKQFNAEEVDIIFADDGLQNTRLPRDMEICVIDGQRLFGNEHLLPAGPLRQSINRLNTVDHIVVNANPEQLDAFNGWLESQNEIQVPAITAMNLLADNIQPLNQAATQTDMEEWRGQAVHAVAAIGNPQRFFHSLEELGMVVRAHIFPDHHRYTGTDFNGINGLPIIMTAKDAIKCEALNLPNAWVLNVQTELNPEAKLLMQIKQLIKQKNSRNVA